MKLYLTILTLFIITFTGCQDTNFDKSIKDDVLLKNDRWYEIDSLSDRYETYKFTDNRLVKEVYSDRSFNDLVDIKYYNIYFTSDSTFNVTQDGVNYSCEVDTCNNDEFIIVGCKANDSSAQDLLYCGWNKKEAADANMR